MKKGYEGEDSINKEHFSDWEDLPETKMDDDDEAVEEQPISARVNLLRLSKSALELVKEARAERAVNKAKMLVESGDSRKISKFFRMAHKGEMDLSDDRIATLYLSASSQYYRRDDEQELSPFDISNAIKHGVSIEQLASIEMAADALINHFTKIVKTLITKFEKFTNEKEADTDEDPWDDYFHISYMDELGGEELAILKQIIDNPALREKLAAGVGIEEIQKYGDIIMRNDKDIERDSSWGGLGDKKRKKLEDQFKILRELGYEPFKDDADVAELLDGFYSLARQENLNAIGLIDPRTVDRLYQLKFDRLKRWTQEHGGGTDVNALYNNSISQELTPSEDNKMANYWRNQTEALGADAMELVMRLFRNGIVQSSYTFDRDAFGDRNEEDLFQSFLEYGDSVWTEDCPEAREFFFGRKLPVLRSRALFKNGIPTNVMFDDYVDDGYISPMHKILRSFWEASWQESRYDEDLMKFCSQNLDLIDDAADKEFVKMWADLGEGPDAEKAKLAFMQWATGSHNIQLGFFDENGVTENFYRSALRTTGAFERLALIDPNWEDHFTPAELGYMKFMNEYLTISFNPDRKIDENLDEYFDENGPKATLANVLLSDDFNLAPGFMNVAFAFPPEIQVSFARKYFFQSNKYRRYLIDIPELVALLPTYMQNYCDFVNKYDADLALIGLPEEAVRAYFDNIGPTVEFWQCLFTIGQYGIITSYDGLDLASVYSESQIAALDLYLDIKDNGFYLDKINQIDKSALRELLSQQDEYNIIMKTMNYPSDIREMAAAGEFVVNESNILSYLSAYIYLDGQDWNSSGIPKDARAAINEAFNESNTKNKNLALEVLKKHWIEYLKSGNPEDYPIILQLLAGHCVDNDGAGPLSQIENFLNYQAAYQPHAEALFSRTSAVEARFKKEKWDDAEMSEYYYVSAEILAASPELYGDFVEFFEKIPSKADFEKFVKEIYPLYRVDLTLQAAYTGGNWAGDETSKASYSHLDSEGLRKDLQNTLLVFNLQELSPERRQDGVDRVREIILGKIKEKFASRFGIVESAVPADFDKADIRAITDLCVYYSNIVGHESLDHDMIGLFLALYLNKEGSQTMWDELRAGGEIDVSKYLNQSKSRAVSEVLQSSRESSHINPENTGLTPERLVDFKRELQKEVVAMRIGNVQTIDMRLTNLVGNILELCDPDLYPDESDKRKIMILEKYPVKTIGAVVAKMHQRAAGREIKFNDEELAIKSDLENLLGSMGVETTPENIKLQLQDGFNLLKLPFNIKHSVENGGAREEIQKLQQMLIPGPEISAIFSKIGEHFSAQSGVVALGADLDFLENLIVKHDSELSEQDEAALRSYLSEIREQMTVLEKIYSVTVETFGKISKSIHSASPEVVAKTKEISQIINGTADQKVITSVCTTQMTTIIENMRQCLSAKSAGINNDTDLTFAEGYKFYLYSRSDSDPNGSISDQIVYLVPTEIDSGAKKLSFVMDLMYGQKTSDVLAGHIQALADKVKALKKQFPEVDLSVLVTNGAMGSVAISSELLTAAIDDPALIVEAIDSVKVDIPKSAYGDHYVEFAGGAARTAGERTTSGVELRVK